MPMLRLDQLLLQYGSNVVLSGLSADLPSGMIHGVVGMNGSGKTSLLRAIHGSVSFQEGSILWQDATLSRQQVGFLETHNYFYPRITGGEYLELFLSQYPGFNLEGWNEVFDLPLKHLIDSYSTGMKKKLAFMGLLALDRPVLILDEPFNGLDLESSEALQKILPQLKRTDRIILITSHIKDTLIHSCDQIHLLKEGRFDASYTAQEFQKMGSLLDQGRIDQIDRLLAKDE